jgi:glyoxylase-like metal-dependent hydrolase (beta-lactamase superfamily II)
LRTGCKPERALETGGISIHRGADRASAGWPGVIRYRLCRPFETATTPFPERLYRWATPVQLPQEQTLETQLRSSGYALTDIRLCLISHFHADHAAGMRDLPNARFIMDAEVSSVLSARSRFALTRHGLLPGLLPEQFRQRLTIAESYPQRALPATGQTSAPHLIFSATAV